MFLHAHVLGGICGAVPGGPVLLLAMLLAGLAGSATHCVPMCGAFVVGQVSDRLAAVPVLKLCELSRLRAGLLIPYHAGRLLTYAALGTFAARAGNLALRFGAWPAALLAAAGAICALQAWRRLVPAAARPAEALAPSRVAVLIVRLGARLDRTRASGGFLLGVLLGFLPCGLLYAALVAAAAAHSPGQGAAAMVAFGLGTVPALVAVGLAGQVFAHARRRLAGRVGGAIMLANAALLWAMAGQVWWNVVLF
jgi:sulfite exporter TauE/SafE